MLSIPLDISEDLVLEDVAEAARIARLPSSSDSSVASMSFSSRDSHVFSHRFEIMFYFYDMCFDIYFTFDITFINANDWKVHKCVRT